MQPAGERIGNRVGDDWCERVGHVGRCASGDRLREVFYGSTRFEDLVHRSGLSEAVTAGRLKELVAHGLLARRPYQEPGARTRHEYVLTDLGSRLFPVLVSLTEWGELLKDDHKTGVELIDKDCGARLTAEIRCRHGHAVALADTAVRIKDETAAKHGRR